MTTSRLAIVLMLLGLAQVGLTASAAIITYTNEAAFLAAIQASPTIVNFEGTDTSGGSPGYTSHGSGTNYGPGNVLTQTGGPLYSVTTGFGAANSDGDTNEVFDGNSGGALTINGSFSAFGMDIMNLSPPTANVFQLAYTGGPGSPLLVTYPGAPLASNPPPAFFGAIGTAGELFTSFISPPGNTPYFDNVILGVAAPEPSSLILCGLGVVGLFIVGRRRQG